MTSTGDEARRELASRRRERRYPGRTALVALVVAVIGGALGYGGFVTGVDAALGGQRPTASIIVFFVGAGLQVVAVVLAILGLLLTKSKILSTIALAIGLLPLAALIVIALANRR